MQLQVFEAIRIQPPREAIYRRLGYRDGITEISSSKQREVDSYISEASNLVELKGAVRRLKIQKKDGRFIYISGDIHFESNLLASLVKDCQTLLCMGVTAGSRIIEVVESLRESDLTKAVIFDATASEMADAGFDWIQRYVRQELLRENKQLTAKRISCGYADFDLSNQLKLYQLLELDKFGVRLTQSFMLVPEKTAIAVAGIMDISR